jgi:hypothetical protein
LGPAADWRAVEELLATLVEIADAQARLMFAFATGKTAPGRPVRVPRPYKQPAPSRRSLTPAELLRRHGDAVAIEFVGKG